MSSNLQIDVCVLGHNRSDLTRVFLPYFVEHTSGVDYKLWFLDNGSNDEGDQTRRVMGWFKANTKRWVPWARYKGTRYKGFHSEINLGFAGGNNFLARQGTAPWILFMNNDAFAENPYWLGILLLTAKRMGWDAIGPVSTEVMGIQCVRWNDDWPSLHPSKKLSGFCFLVRRSVFEDIGGWDEDFMNGDEDCDISIRIRERAWKKEGKARPIGVNRGVYVHHLCSESMEGWCESIGETIKEHFQKTRVQLCTKHDPRNQIDLFYWEDLRTPPERWREHGVLPNGKYYQRPGDPVTGARTCGRLNQSLSGQHSVDCNIEGGVREAGTRDTESQVLQGATGVHRASCRQDRAGPAGTVGRNGDVGRERTPSVVQASKLYTPLRGAVCQEPGNSELPGREGARRSDGHRRLDSGPRTGTGETQEYPGYHLGATADAFYVGVGFGGRQCPLSERDCTCGTCEASSRAPEGVS